MKDKLPKKYILPVIFLAVTALAVIYFGELIGFLSALAKIMLPLFIGFGLAYVIEIIRLPMSRLIFPHAESGSVQKIKRALLITVIMLLLLAFAALVISLIIPSLEKTATVFVNSVPALFDSCKIWILDRRDIFPTIADKLDTVDEFTMTELIQFLSGYFSDTKGSLIGLTGSFISSTVSTIYTAVMSIIFAVYVIYNKSLLKRQFLSLVHVFLKEPHSSRFLFVCNTANACLRSFITSQGIQAMILTGFCISGMLIFGFPEPVMIGIFMGVTSLVPLIGSYIGSTVGVLIVLAKAPSQAIWFLLFMIVIQQVVGNVIYPKIAGKKFGLPGMWVLASVIIGGGLFGILGMIIGVPVMATAYQLLKIYIHSHRSQSSCENTVDPVSDCEK